MDFKQQLIHGDPVAREPGLDELHAQTIRQRMLLEARSTRVEREDFNRAFGRTVEREGFSRAFVVAGALAACLVAGVSIGLRMNVPQPIAPAGRPFQGGQDQPQTRQLQFATPGGTRIIWTFHQEFDL